MKDKELFPIPAELRETIEALRRTTAFDDLKEVCRLNEIDIPSALEMLRDEFYPLYRLHNEYNGIDFYCFAVNLESYYAAKTLEYINTDQKYHVYMELRSFVTFEIDRFEISDNIVPARKSSKKVPETVPVRMLLLEKIIESPEILDGLSKNAIKHFIHTVLNADNRTLEGYTNSKNYQSKEGKYILTPEHYKQVKQFFDNLQTID